MRIAPRMLAPLFACAIAGASAIVGSACILPTPSNPPKLETGNYVLAVINGQSPPGTFTDSARTLHVFTDTFNLNASTQFYDEHMSVAITPRGGVEQPVQLIIIEHQPFTLPSVSTVNFLITVFGLSTTATILSTTSFQLQLSDHTAWRYDKR